MKIAIVGAGFSGMALAWNLVKHTSVNITLFDPNGIGGGASGIAAGLLHPFAGLHSKLNWKGREGMEATRILLDSINPPVFSRTGLIRIALTEENEKDYALCAQRFPEEVIWLEADELQAFAPQATLHPGIHIKSAVTVYSDLYLKSLWEFCSQKGVILEKTEISSLEELKHFDAILVANGASACGIKELADLPITAIKGQILELSWPKDLPPLSMPLTSQVYILMTPGNQTCLVGATYERNFTTVGPDAAFAAKDLLPKAMAIIPELKNSKILDCRVGLRASAPHHHPISRKINSNCWILSGMGSKGLLYHALFAEELSKEIMSSAYFSSFFHVE
jgi:glycine/D-amino acid oxidase-like deaminating enzyme